MRALITNDDGIDSPGLAVLARVALAAGYDVTVAAPATEHSGASACLFGVEEDGRLSVEETACPDLPDGVRSLAVGGSPALIAFLAADGGFGPRPTQSGSTPAESEVGTASAGTSTSHL